MAIRIFIDQGHNPSGWNTGAEGSGLREQDVTFLVGAYLANLLDQDPRFEVRVSRGTPETMVGVSNSDSLTQRVNMANSWPADYFLSLHCNAAVQPSANGTEVCVYARYTQSYWLGEHILHAIVSRMGTRDRGMSLRPGLYVLRKTQMPSVLAELAFLSNAEDAALLREDPYGFAAAVYEGLLSYFDMAPLKE